MTTAPNDEAGTDTRQRKIRSHTFLPRNGFSSDFDGWRMTGAETSRPDRRLAAQLLAGGRSFRPRSARPRTALPAGNREESSEDQSCGAPTQLLLTSRYGPLRCSGMADLFGGRRCSPVPGRRRDAIVARPPGRRRVGDMPACGQLLRHLTTGFGQPAGSVGPLQVAHLPPPTTTAACLKVPINHPHQKERRPNDLRQTPVAETALVNIDGPQTCGPFPSIEVGHTGLSKRHWVGAPHDWYSGDSSGFPAGNAVRGLALLGQPGAHHPRYLTGQTTTRAHSSRAPSHPAAVGVRVRSRSEGEVYATVSFSGVCLYQLHPCRGGHGHGRFGAGPACAAFHTRRERHPRIGFERSTRGGPGKSLLQGSRHEQSRMRDMSRPRPGMEHQR